MILFYFAYFLATLGAGTAAWGYTYTSRFQDRLKVSGGSVWVTRIVFVLFICVFWPAIVIEKLVGESD